MNALLYLQIGYVLVVLFTILRIIYDTRSSPKALAYILFVIYVPIIGILFYFSFGVNYRKRKLYAKKLGMNDSLRLHLLELIDESHKKIKESDSFSKDQTALADLIYRSTGSPLTSEIGVELLVNGEEKFPRLLGDLKQARHHIHIEYYIYESDETGKEIAEVLMERALAGVEVRVIYDDFGSHSISKELLGRMKKAGVEIAPFYKINFFLVASRINYRNHRKIVVIDGNTSYVGGINISDRYRNDRDQKLFWRDTHLRLSGTASAFLQFIFVSDWNFCSAKPVAMDKSYFPERKGDKDLAGEVVQIVPSGPDSATPAIYHSLIKAIAMAKEKILITNPYFIPGDSLMDALGIAARSGVEIKIIVPGVSDSRVVNAAARPYYTELIAAGAEVYLYQKGFVHAKTMVIDHNLSFVGTANMDYRSFDLNFEVNAVLYGRKIASELSKVFDQDLAESEQIDPQLWLNRSKLKRMPEKIARLLSPFL